MKTKAYRIGAAIALLAALEGCGGAASDSGWSLVGGSSFEERHSPLKKIDTENVKDLGLAWKFDNFEVRGRVNRGNQGTPLVMGRTMYFTGPWSMVYAADAVTGKELWRYNPEVDGACHPLSMKRVKR